MVRFLRCSILALMLVSIFLLSCDRRNPLKPNALPPAKLTLTGEMLPVPGTDDFVLRQTAAWTEDAEPGTLLAWRICTTDSIMPAGIVTDTEGWIYHYAAGADTQIPLSQPGSHRTIWTSAVSQSWELPPIEGKLSRVIIRADVRVQSPGHTEQTASASFRTDRLVGTQINTSFPEGATVGLGICINLQETISDIYQEGLYAHHFMYRINKLGLGDQIISMGEWHSTLDCTDIRQIKLSGYSLPALTPDFDAGIESPKSTTQLEVYVVSRQGIVQATPQSTRFHVMAGFSPGTMIMRPVTMGLGQYHYSTPMPSNVLQEYCFTSDNTHWGTPFFKEDSVYTAINSPGFKVQLAWGWYGQYGDVWPMYYYEYTDNPMSSRLNHCVDEYTGRQYYSEIEYYDLRLDDHPFPASSQFGSSSIVVRPDGSLWRRIRNNGELSSCRFILTGLADGTHKFNVSAVDLQGVYDPTPAQMEFALKPFVPASARSGILVVDDDPNNISFAPDSEIDLIYESIVPDDWGNVDTIDYSAVSVADGWNRKLSPTLLQNYKLIIWHDDFANQSMNLPFEADGLEIYLANQGNLLVSGGANLKTCLNAVNSTDPVFLSGYMLEDPNSYCSSVTNTMLTSPFFIQAISLEAGLPDMSLNTTTSYNHIVNTRKGLGPVTIFTENSAIDALYRYGCRLPGPVNSPDQATYDLLSTRNVAIRKQTSGGGKVILLGFPLSLMETDGSRPALEAMITGILGRQGI